MFVAFSEEELRLAKEAMSSTDISKENTMNIDIAKMMQVIHMQWNNQLIMCDC